MRGEKKMMREVYWIVGQNNVKIKCKDKNVNNVKIKMMSKSKASSPQPSFTHFTPDNYLPPSLYPDHRM